MTIKVLRCQEMQTSSHCKIPEQYCKSKSNVNIQKDDNYCFLGCIFGLFMKLLYIMIEYRPVEIFPRNSIKATYKSQ